MCATCGCSDGDAVRIVDPREIVPTVAAGHEHHDHEHHDHEHHDHEHHDHDQGHDHARDSGHSHDHQEFSDAGQQSRSRTLVLEEQILAKNDRLAQHNRGWFDGRGILAVNVMGSPGAGKTTLLEQTVRSLGTDRVGVVEGDQETSFDADRIRAAGAPVVQINTGSGCHLDATMLRDAVLRLDPQAGSTLFIENVGNLVCPALFDLGESTRVVVVSVTEGEDKPLKYPHMFRSADLVLLTKSDLLAHLEFDADRFWALTAQVSRDSERLQVSATTGEGLEAWCAWLLERRPAATTPAAT